LTIIVFHKGLGILVVFSLPRWQVASYAPFSVSLSLSLAAAINSMRKFIADTPTPSFRTTLEKKLLKAEQKFYLEPLVLFYFLFNYLMPCKTWN
jgi:hypothetical protein